MTNRETLKRHTVTSSLPSSLISVPKCNNDINKECFEPPTRHAPLQAPNNLSAQQTPSAFTQYAWAVDKFLQLSDFEFADKVRRTREIFPLDTCNYTTRSKVVTCLLDDRKRPWQGLENWNGLQTSGFFRGKDIKGLLSAEVPELVIPQASNATSYRPTKSNMPLKKLRIELSDDEKYFTVPDLG